MKNPKNTSDAKQSKFLIVMKSSLVKKYSTTANQRLVTFISEEKFDPYTEKYVIFSPMYNPKKTQNVKLWLPFIENKINMENALNLVEIPKNCSGKKLIPFMRIALYFEADGLIVSDRHADVAVPYVLDFLKKSLEKKENAACSKKIAAHRKEVDSLDEKILQLIGERNQLTSEMAKLKKSNGQGIIQPERWRTMIAKRIVSSGRYDIRKENTEKFFNLLHEMALQIHIDEYFSK